MNSQTEHTVTEKAGKEELLTAIEEAVSGLRALIASLKEEGLNSVPYKDSWTAGQLIRHVVKSINGMAGAMRMKAAPAGRNPGERIAELKKTFLDFSSKLQSPEFIIPEDRHYQKPATLNELDGCLQGLKEAARTADLAGLVEGLPLGPVTKLEMLHFVLYHTQRHLHQLQRICDALKVQQ